jgi:2,3-bisphosphoglycerate-independent phosphoglycerate mutase
VSISSHSTSFYNPLLLLILDGWGIAKNPHGNAIAQAHTPQWDFLWQQAQHQPQGCLLQASGKAVSLPANQVGNSEIGHLTLGAGRTSQPVRVDIDDTIQANTLTENTVWQSLVAHLKQHKQATIHFVGLLSDGGVHSHLAHLAELLGLAKDEGLQKVRVHALTDGRDVPPFSVQDYLYDVEGALLDLDYPQISTVMGRFFAMDRDNRWHRTEQAFRALAFAQGKRELMSTQAVKHVLAEGISEELIPPAITEIEYEGLAPNDVVFFWHFREDRLRQLAEALTNPQFAEFNVSGLPQGLKVASFVPIGSGAWSEQISVLFPKKPIEQTLGQLVAQAGLKQLRLAETEKYPHVTAFFNGGIERPFLGEERLLIPSLRHVETYDLQPEMALPAVVNHLVKALEGKRYGLIVANFANADMVGHTGNFPATVAACEAVDSALEQVVQACKQSGTHLLITADHGNAEAMLTGSDAPNTAHALSPVPFIWLPADGNATQAPLTQVETLADVAPFILKVMGLPIPTDMIR